MAYAIMRNEKRKRGAVYGLQIEATRTGKDSAVRDFPDSDIDWSRTDDNIRLRECSSWGKEITRQIKTAGARERADSVVMIDSLYTASPEFFRGKDMQQIQAFFRDCLDYHEREFGPAFSAVIHLDEKTPHMQVASVPLVTDENGVHLSAKMLMGGRSDYHKRQERFWQEVGRGWGLDRGEPRDPASKSAKKDHLTKREWQVQEQEQRADAAQRQLQDAKAAAAKTIERADSLITSKTAEIDKLNAELMTRQQIIDLQAKTRSKGDYVRLKRSEFEQLQRTAGTAEALLKEVQPARDIIARKDEIIREAEAQGRGIVDRARAQADSLEEKAAGIQLRHMKEVIRSDKGLQEKYKQQEYSLDHPGKTFRSERDPGDRWR